MPELIGTAEAARRLGISTSTVKRWVIDGRLPVAAQGAGPLGPRLLDAGIVDQLVPVKPKTHAERMAWLEKNA